MEPRIKAESKRPNSEAAVTLSNAPAPAETVRKIVARALAPKAWASEVGYAQENRRKASLKHADAALAAIAAHGLALVPVERLRNLIEQADSMAHERLTEDYEAFGPPAFITEAYGWLAAAPLSPPVGAWRQQPVQHKLKTWPAFFDAILSGAKRHELRRADRPFAVNDMLELQEFDPTAGAYTGRSMLAKVTYITSAESVCAFSPLALAQDFCILSIERLPPPPIDVKAEGET